jgi:hypothetical protein
MGLLNKLKALLAGEDPSANTPLAHRNPRRLQCQNRL